MPANSNPTTDRQIRVFVSSTFRDMKAERDHLVKFIFPQIRQHCDQRGVVWDEVDLRWGVTDEQKAEGKMFAICLLEIEHYRPNRWPKFKMSTPRRTIRLFVSSTFSDMKAERDMLHSAVVPKLRQLCWSEGLRFQPIDLRWGVRTISCECGTWKAARVTGCLL